MPKKRFAAATSETSKIGCLRQPRMEAGSAEVFGSETNSSAVFLLPGNEQVEIQILRAAEESVG